MTDWLNVGKIVNTHGVMGEIRVISSTDFPEERYATGNKLYAVNDKGVRSPLEVTSWRKHKQFDLLFVKGYDTLSAAEQLKGQLLQVDKSTLNDELLEGEFYYRDIIGAEVSTESGETLGTVIEILSPGANDVWVIKRKEQGKDILIPYIDEVVKHVDIDNKKVIIHPMEGLLD